MTQGWDEITQLYWDSLPETATFRYTTLDTPDREPFLMMFLGPDFICGAYGNTLHDCVRNLSDRWSVAVSGALLRDTIFKAKGYDFL